MENRQVPSPNAYDFYLAACEAMVYEELPESCSGGCACEVEQRDLTMDEKGAIVQRNSAALRMLREGFEHEFLVPPNKNLQPPELGTTMGCRWLAKLLRMESEVLSAKGYPAGAMSSLLDAVHMGSDLPRGGLFIDALVGRAVEAIGLLHSWEIIDELDSQSARSLARRAECICSRSWPFAETLEDEKRWGLADLTQQCRHWHWRIILASQCAHMLGWPEFLRALLHMVTLNKNAVLADYERYMDAHIAHARMPYSVAKQQPDVEGNYDSRCIGAQSAASLQIDNGETQKTFLATAIALHAYRLDHGAYPSGLSDLVPEYLDAVPNDPFAGDATLHYRIDDDRYVLYSVGPDGIDDGGKPIFDPRWEFAPRAQYRAHANSKGDIVAGVNW